VDTTRSENDHGMARCGFMMVNLFPDVYIAILRFGLFCPGQS
jgi:hypothetical protein